MKNHFNDSPIETAEEDLYGVSSFSKAISQCIMNIESPIGTTISLHGPWGSGKSSVVNLVRTALTEQDRPPIISEFKCWWYRGEEALALAFLQNLNSILCKTFEDKVKDLIPKIGRNLLQAGPVISSAIALTPAGSFSPFINKTFDFTKRFFPADDSLELMFHKLSEILAKQDRRFLIIIDDIDRLDPDEGLAIFRLVKSVGRLPNVMYLLVFDRIMIESIIKNKYPSEDSHFLEKIIQAGFELPTPLQVDLNKAVLDYISTLCGDLDDEQGVRLMNVFYDVVAPYIISPRHVNRLKNALSVTWPAIANEVDFSDFFALETLRLYEPNLFKSIKMNKDKVCGLRQEHVNQNDDERFNVFFKNIPEDRQDVARTSLMRLFPRFENMGYLNDFIRIWSSQRRVCIETHFDTYFRLSLSEDVLPFQQIDDFVKYADDKSFIQSSFRKAVKTERREGQTMVPVYLEELTIYAKKIPREKVLSLISALFEIHDEIDVKADDEKGFMGMINTTVRYHWLIRGLMRDRFSLEERTRIYLDAIKNASLGWLVDFTSSALDDYEQHEDRPPKQESGYLVNEEALSNLINRALKGIRAAASNGSLLNHRDLIFILYRWGEFMNNDFTEAKAWTDGLLADSAALITLAQRMTGMSWSAGIGGFGALGDRVARPSITARIGNDSKILDVRKFREALEIICKEGKGDAIGRQDVQKFLEAWDRKGQEGD